jgi:7,8-dihydropterin-6-yl-methyl-4-(beta-D-ribofuranosyl)aminobenzene 5'-phosphate synthase
MSSKADSVTLSLQESGPKITILYDNRKGNTRLKEGFGFSCFIEWRGRNILFDTGGKVDAFFSNIKALDLPLSQTTSVVFSHHHWDHTAAIDQVLKQVPAKTTVYIPNPFSRSLEKRIPSQIQIKKVAHVEEIDSEVYTLVLTGGYWLSSITEQMLLLKTPKGVVIITGCAHPGIVKIVEEAKKLLGDIHMVIGGFHLHHSWCCTSAKVVRQFKRLGVEKVAPCHCAGDTAIRQFEGAYGEDFIRIGTGSVIQI